MHKPDRRPKHEVEAIRTIMQQLNIKYMAALKEYERRLEEERKKNE